ncbi:hypothetical protein WJX73_002715 [Symbiochloris irregularis]|uniref:PDZ domain-containing protein n=1 Tax=Symbiochloris irregularis TaxID=706552 RepID=A0AAW1NVI1_9CHLO
MRAKGRLNSSAQWHQPISAILLSLALLLQPVSAAVAQSLPEPVDKAAQPSSYEQEARKRRKRPNSNLPSKDVAERMLNFDKDAYTPDGWEGMKGVLQYARYVDGLCGESEPGCEQCADNRLLLEQAWQVVSTEFFDPHGEFSQARWAAALLNTLQDAGGYLHNKRELYTAAHAMLGTLHDRYSDFLPPAEFRKALRRPSKGEREYLAAQYTGTGVQLGGRAPAGGWQIVSPLAESAAEQAGILPGERLLEINGYPMDDMTASEVEACMRGCAGSIAVLTIAGASPNSPHRLVDLERRALPQPPVQQGYVMAPDGQKLMYIRVHYFSSEATRVLRNAVMQGDSEGAVGIIFDLRNNPGGVFEEAMACAALLLQRGCQIAATVRAGGGDIIDAVFRTGALPVEVFPGQPQEQLTDLPAAILVNSASASASEVFAGALHDNHRAVLIGEKTFGKGVVQYFFPMTDGSGVKATVAKYLTPNGYDITRAGGLAPDKACRDYPHAGNPSMQADSCIGTAVQLLHPTHAA